MSQLFAFVFCSEYFPGVVEEDKPGVFEFSLRDDELITKTPTQFYDGRLSRQLYYWLAG